MYGQALIKQNRKLFIIIKNMLRELFFKDKLTYSRPHLRLLTAVNVYQIYLYQHLNFMEKVSSEVTLVKFNAMFKMPSDKYPTNFSHNDFRFKNFL